jgi:hypothetical protein
MSTFKRHRFPWSANEIERLWREYENKELTIQQISALHQRSVDAILYKLEAEGLIDHDWACARGYTEYAEMMNYPIINSSKISSKEEEKYEDNQEDENFEDDTNDTNDENYDLEDDANDEDYVEGEDEDYVEGEDDCSEESEESEELDVYSIKQQMNFLQEQIFNIKSIVTNFLSNPPKKEKKLAPLRKPSNNANLYN